MKVIELNDLEKLYGKAITTKDLSIFGVHKKIPFHVFDGFAESTKLVDGHSYSLIYPTTAFVKDSTYIQDQIKEYQKITDAKDIQVLDILQTFSKLFIDGVEQVYDDTTKQYQPKTYLK